MTEFTLKFSKTNSFHKFFVEIDNTVKAFIKDLEPNESPPTFATFWQAALNKNVLKSHSRATISRNLVGRAVLPKGETPSQTLDIIITYMRDNLPFLDEKYHFNKFDDEEMYVVTLRQPTTTSTNAAISSKWKTPPTKSTFTQKSIENYTKATAPTSAPNTNKFAILGQSDSPDSINDNIQTQDDADLSYDPSSQEPSPNINESNPTVVDTKDVPANSNDDDNVQPNFATIDETKEIINIIDQVNANNSSDAPKIDDNEKDISQSVSSDDITDDEFLLLHEALENRKVHLLDTNLLARWVNNVATDVHTSDTLLNNHKNNIEMFLDKKCETLKKKLVEHAELVSHTQNKKLVEKSVDIRNEHKRELRESIELSKAQHNREKDKVQQWISESKLQMTTIQNEIRLAENESIMCINRCGNQHLTDMKDLVQQSTELVQSLQKCISDAANSRREVKSSLTHLRTQTQELYQRFGDDITEAADEERDLFRTWLAERKKLLDGNSEIFHELNTERDLLRAERRLLSTERDLWKKDRLEFQEWADDMKASMQNANFPNIGMTSTSMPYSRKNVSTSPPESSSHHPAPLFKGDDPVHFVNNKYDVHGYIMNTIAPNFEDGTWKYAIYTAEGNKIYECEEQSIRYVHDTVPPGYTAPPTPAAAAPAVMSPPRAPHFQQDLPGEYKHQMSTPESNFQHYDQHRPWMRPRQPSQRPLATNEFIYPLGTPPKQVFALHLYKAAKNWELQIHGSHDLRGFYERLQGQLESYNIYIRNYDSIVLHEHIAAINSSNCTNSEAALQCMTKTIFNLLDQNKDKIFLQYPEPLAYIESFRPKLDGLGFLKHIMRKRHPNLREITTERKEDTAPPTMSNSASIFTFINQYVEWLHDEQLRNNRKYTKHEQIIYVLDELDEDLYSAAKKSIHDDLQALHLYSRNPKPFPQHLHVDENLGLYIVGLLPTNTQTAIYDDIARQLQRSTLDSAHINKVNRDDSQKKRYQPREDRKSDDDEWVKQLKWEIMPNETCAACYKSNHNIYKTGCPTFATFAVCNEFYKTVPKDKLDKVIEAYKKYQRQLSKQKRERRNQDRRFIRTLEGDFESADVAQVKKTMFNRYLQDFKDEQYCTENPYDTLEAEPPSEDE